MVKVFDSVENFLIQPWITKKEISIFNCTSSPKADWKILSISDDEIPKDYQICITSTRLSESSYEDLNSGIGKPGIYILYSKPVNGITYNSTPLRRIFCRPKPFCS